MPIAKLKGQLGFGKPKGEEPPGPDERDLKIARLERAIEEERAHSASLRRTIDDLNFKAEILEQSYSKQLTDTRSRCDAAEASLAEHRTRLAEYEGTGKDAHQLLADARAELERVTAERDRLRRGVATGTTVPAARPAPVAGHASAPADQWSIDDLLEDAIWAQEQEKINRERRGIAPKPASDIDATSEELIPPELVLAPRREHDD
jgi:DNA repair exonuclease SbcCD ATPase subunit